MPDTDNQTQSWITCLSLVIVQMKQLMILSHDITEILKCLHWLPDELRIKYKILLITIRAGGSSTTYKYHWSSLPTLPTEQQDSQAPWVLSAPPTDQDTPPPVAPASATLDPVHTPPPASAPRRSTHIRRSLSMSTGKIRWDQLPLVLCQLQHIFDIGVGAEVDWWGGRTSDTWAA